MRSFIERGYTNTSCSSITKQLQISPGNLTFYFPTKEDLLAELVEELCDFQWKVMEETNNDGKSPLYSYCMELVSMISACEQSAIARDFYLACYTHPKPLAVIRRNDTVKTRRIFEAFCPDFAEADFACAEQIASGIEFSAMISESTDQIPLEKRIRFTLDSVLRLYNVPAQLRQQKIDKVLASDYSNTAHKLLPDFTRYTEEVNERNVQLARDYMAHHSAHSIAR